VPRNAEDRTIRVLGPDDAERVVRMATDAFGTIDFYTDVLGVDTVRLQPFFSALFGLLLRDPGARVYGLERHGHLSAACVVALPGFPSARHVLPFAAALVRAVGFVRFMRYLRFVQAYERAMHIARDEACSEARAYWLFVDPGAATARCGSDLARGIMAELESRGWRLVTGFVDASNTRLLALYRRLGFTVGEPFPFLGRQGARIWCRLPRPSPVSSC
jgi:ribosomal protein S18 acetylase RimI-like enzyme